MRAVAVCRFNGTRHRLGRLSAQNPREVIVEVPHDLADCTYQGAAFAPYGMTREQIQELRQIALRRFYSRILPPSSTHRNDGAGNISRRDCIHPTLIETIVS